MRAAAGEFVDTNILVYACTTDPRAARAQELLARGCIISVQILDEFASVAIRKLGMSWAETREALAAVRALCRAILPLDLPTHAEAIAIAERYRYAIFDALIVAAALHSGCAVLWTEDLQHGAVIDGRLRIANPFAAG